MVLQTTRIQEAERLLSNLLGSELAEIIERVSASPGTDKSFLIEIPETSSIDYNVEELASLVARTANRFGQISRLSSMARAELKRAEGRYKRKYKASLVGKNTAEREANAIEASENEAEELTIIEMVVELASGAEAWARIASETARKLYSGSENMQIATVRESKGYYKESDFKDGF